MNLSTVTYYYQLLLQSYCVRGWMFGWVRTRLRAQTHTALWRGCCSLSRSPDQRSDHSVCEESADSQERPPSCRSVPSAQIPWRNKDAQRALNRIHLILLFFVDVTLGIVDFVTKVAPWNQIKLNSEHSEDPSRTSQTEVMKLKLWSALVAQ